MKQQLDKMLSEKYDKVWDDFSEGLAKVKLYGGWIEINKDGDECYFV